MIGLDDPLDNVVSSPILPDSLRHSPYYNQMQEQDEVCMIYYYAYLIFALKFLFDPVTCRLFVHFHSLS